MKTLFKILNHQHILCYNIPYDDDSTISSYNNGYYRGKKEALMGDIPTQTALRDNFPFAGYIDISGKIYECNPCEHEKMVRDIVYNNDSYFNKYRNLPASFYDSKPQGMLQEEYFLMKELGFVKISSFEKAPTKRILFRYKDLTWMQSDIVFPT